ncbi:MAG TPA: zinc-binding alcohol dehydrogenase family protein [Gammaproteobacteria bacterium]
MRVMAQLAPGEPLVPVEQPIPAPEPGQALIRVEACAVCRTDLHVVDGELPDPRRPLVPGHQVVGRVVEGGGGLSPGTRVGVPWLGWTCGACRYCASGRENLCDRALFTGYTLPGGYAEYLAADARFCVPLDPGAPATALAPLLCAGLIGYRALRMCGDAERVGLYGFGAAAHVLAQVLRHQGRACYAFTRPGDAAAQAAALALGARWAGGSDQRPPEALDAAIIFAPVGALVPAALAAVRKGGVVVCGGIHMSPLPSMPYELLWGERELKSVANLTRADAAEFLPLAASIPIRPEVNVYPLAKANEALADLRAGAFTGSAVLAVA